MEAEIDRGNDADQVAPITKIDRPKAKNFKAKATKDVLDIRLFYQFQEFGLLFGWSRTKVFELVKQKKIKTAQVMGQRRIPASERDRLQNEFLANAGNKAA